MQMQSFSRQGTMLYILMVMPDLTTTLRYGDSREPLRNILGPEAGARLRPIWGLDPEGEICGAWRDIGIPRAWYMTGDISSCHEGNEAESKAGNFALCRFHSKHLALRTFLFPVFGGFTNESAMSNPQKSKQSKKACLMMKRGTVWRHLNWGIVRYSVK